MGAPFPPPHIGNLAPYTGRYRPEETHKHTPIIHMQAGKPFPPCAHCHFNIHWDYIGQ